MISLIANSTMILIDNIMKYVLIGTIILGVIFLCTGLIMIAKQIKYSMQVRHNKQEIEKYKKEQKEIKQKV